MHVCLLVFFFFFKQKTAYEMRISDWSSDVCSSDLPGASWVPRQLGCGLILSRRAISASVTRSDRSLSTSIAVSPRRCPAAGRPRPLAGARCGENQARQSVVQGKRVSVSVALGGRSVLKKKKNDNITSCNNQSLQ